MRRFLTFIMYLFVAAWLGAASAEDVIVFTANQEWLSRIYVLRMDGSVLRYFEYDFYRFVDMEVVENELYVSEAFAPRVYRVDVATGDLEVIIDDWTLYYFYGLAFDGTFFYVDEWDLNRYDVEGVKDGVASFDESVLGSAWDGSFYWTLDDSNHISCWDISGWPAVTAVQESAFVPPTPACRGLWFDGEHFWTAESQDNLGYIYRFDRDGQVISQWIEPAFSGWGACVMVGQADTIPPAPIADLAVSRLDDSSATLAWTAPGDDVNEGTVEVYDLRYSTTPVETDTVSWWNAADTVDGEPSPSSPGTTDSCRLSGLMPNTAYYFVIRAGDNVPNWSGFSNVAMDTTPGVGIEELRCGVEPPEGFRLVSSHPNPFNAVTEIGYALGRDCLVRLDVYNGGGQRVATLVNGEQKAGYRNVRWDASSFSSGVYFCRLRVEGFVETRSVVLIK